MAVARGQLSSGDHLRRFGGDGARLAAHLFHRGEPPAERD